jgi:hypothetical protein
MINLTFTLSTQINTDKENYSVHLARIVMYGARLTDMKHRALKPKQIFMYLCSKFFIELMLLLKYMYAVRS